MENSMTQLHAAVGYNEDDVRDFLAAMPRGLITGQWLQGLMRFGIIEGAADDQLNASSIDVTLGNKVLQERAATPMNRAVVSLRSRTPLQMDEVGVDEKFGYELRPHRFVLAHTREKFNLPNSISASYTLKSSMARMGLEHLNAGWCDPGWHGSVLTLELKNMTQNHTVLLHYGDRIGQMIFFHHDEVSEEISYATKGRYNRDSSVSGVKP